MVFQRCRVFFLFKIDYSFFLKKLFFRRMNVIRTKTNALKKRNIASSPLILLFLATRVTPPARFPKDKSDSTNKNQDNFLLIFKNLRLISLNIINSDLKTLLI